MPWAACPEISDIELKRKGLGKTVYVKKIWSDRKSVPIDEVKALANGLGIAYQLMNSIVAVSEQLREERLPGWQTCMGGRD
jgi:hypothetical protein